MQLKCGANVSVDINGSWGLKCLTTVYLFSIIILFSSYHLIRVFPILVLDLAELDELDLHMDN